MRLLKAHAFTRRLRPASLCARLVGMVLSFVAGSVALKWLSHWLEGGRWKFFGFYCLAAAAAVLVIHFMVKY